MKIVTMRELSAKEVKQVSGGNIFLTPPVPLPPGKQIHKPLQA